ncbi:hypothetical protein CYMTET_43755 [Cymbomonas tetramitiformis]|uniref:Uncharacterized protein n=1 Tax=Cymbomonas tetramitiformis TaxID=36881 RepID=A0AAE0C3H3_9CHLO|nr:hypothetical protein CYMTET_43755 [Cymbomonas tetramitiformis]
MHDGDKLGRSAVGALVRTKQKKPVNPFKAGQDVMAQAHKLGVYFNYSTRHANLMSFGVVVKNVAPLRIAVDHNTTRVASQHGLLISEIRLNRAIAAYQGANPTVEWALTGEAWRHMAEFEGVLNITKITTTLSQLEKPFTGAYCCLVKGTTMSELRSDHLPVVALDKVTASPKLPRVLTPVSQLSAAGQECRRRAILEGERRFCGNVTEEISGGPLEVDDRELTCMLLDLRTVGANHVSLVQRRRAVALLAKAYVDFGMQCAEYDAEKAAEEAAAAAAKVAAVTAARQAAAADQAQSQPKVSTSSVKSGHLYGVSAWSDMDMDILLSGEDAASPAVVAPDAVAPAVVAPAAMAPTVVAPAVVAPTAVAPAAVVAPVAVAPTTSAPELDMQKERKRLEEEFKRVFKNWVAIEVDWRKEFPEVVFGEEIDVVSDLLQVDIGRLYLGLKSEDLNRKEYGWLTLMASSSAFQIGALMAESICERVLSCANQVLVDGNTLLSDAEIEMIVLLRMNREFMEYMRRNFGNLSRQQFNMTVIGTEMENE